MTLNFDLYAGDLKIYNTIRNLNDVRGLKDDIDRIYVWCINNKLSLNIQKCKYIQFSKSFLSSSQNYYFIKNMFIENIDLIKDLGVLLDCKLTFTQQVENCCNKAL